MRHRLVSFWARTPIKVPLKVVVWDREGKKKIILKAKRGLSVTQLARKIKR